VIRLRKRVGAVATLICLLVATHAVLAQELTLTPLKPGGIYARGEKAGWTVTPPAGAPPQGYTYSLRKNNLDIIKSGELDTSRPTTIETTLNEPAMLFLEVRSPAPEAHPQVAGAAIAPTQLQPAVPRPKDFDDFWARKIRALQKVPANPVLTPGPSGKPDISFATLRMDHLNGRHIHGQIAKPDRPGKFPGLVIFQWASPPYPLQKPWVTDRAAEGWLALNIEPHDVLPDQPQSYYDALPQQLKQYQEIGRDNRDENYFLQMYLSDFRAVEYLASRTDWDGKTLVVMGTSMGGQQSLCTAAFNSRVTALIVHVPAGADASGPLHGRASGYPNWPADDPKAMATAPYFDTVNCASRIRVPSLVSMGFVDTVTPPVGIFTAFNQIRGPKEAVPMFESPHNHQATPEQQEAYTIRSTEWLKTLVAGGDVFERADRPSPRLDENSLKAHEQLLQKRKQGVIDVYFLGDSITRRWGAAEPKYQPLLANWRSNFTGWNAADFGWGGDKTQNILWRLEHGELDGVNPKVIVLMAGTNNVGRLTPVGNESTRIDEIVDGIRAIIARCHEKAPGAKIVLAGITPRNDNMAVMPIIDGVNARLASLVQAADSKRGPQMRFLNLNAQLADANGKLFEGMTDPDRLHLTTKAYQVWADALKPILTEWLGPPASTDRAPPPTGDPSAMPATH
jgi:cephalosporin-C deacetylase-like acetyl esterase/lysophospholipase L1-like esterase